MPTVREVYMVLSPRALSYAKDALESLFRNSMQPLRLRLITDSEQDKEELSQAVSTLDAHSHQWSVYSEDDLADREEALFGRYPNLRTFRHGHPCWRKITDPLLLSEPGAELVLLDPDLYFPNRFQFEVTPQTGVMLMWQKFHCLFPPEVVKTVMSSKIPVAHHVDIGVANWRADADLDWMEWFIGSIGGASLPRIPHVEAILWSALAMRIGGSYLDPLVWKCWIRTPAKRVMAKLGVSGQTILKSEPFADVKCFHAGGEAKYWLHACREAGMLDSQGEHTKPGRNLPYVELFPADYARERKFKQLLKSLGYYQIFRPV